MSDITVHLLEARKPRRPFWIGVLVGVLAMSAADLTDLHLCIGQCDGEDLSLLDLFEQPVSRKTDRLLPTGDLVPKGPRP